jgi:small-conductance mechanosensitive channel
LAAVGILGISMTNVTILVSALGVGVGFGLQNIVNNFISGLILLFERPVRVGDSIQVGDATGVVQRIGIRASILLTTSGSEIIVPNGSLISDRITNWTLSHRRWILVIPVNVARGPAPEHIMEVLRNVAVSHPLVTRDPPPLVLITNLGVTLSFELRAWTAKAEQWTQIRSDLSLAINTALAKENILFS